MSPPNHPLASHLIVPSGYTQPRSLFLTVGSDRLLCVWDTSNRCVKGTKRLPLPSKAVAGS